MDDLISRQAALKSQITMKAHGLDWIPAYHIEQLPSAERHGRWVDVEPAPHNLFYATCSVCGDRQTIEVANYCPMCGASMDEVLNED